MDSAQQVTATAVDLALDGDALQTVYGIERSDVARTLGRPAYLQSGFLAALPASRVTRGRHLLALRVAAADRRCYYETPPLIVVGD